MAGDTGASEQDKYQHELSVADQMTADCRTSDERNRPHFLFHLGDVVYSFGESKYYYDQFYDPFRDYPAPIFAIPGTPAGETPLDAHEPNFGANVAYMDKDPVLPSKGLVLKHYDDVNYGYLRVEADAKNLRIGFHQVGTSTIPQSRVDLVTIDIAKHRVVAN